MDKIKKRNPIPKNVYAKLLSTKNVLNKNPRPPLANRTDELRLAIIGRYSSGKSVKIVETELWLIVQPIAMPPKITGTIKIE